MTAPAHIQSPRQMDESGLPAVARDLQQSGRFQQAESYWREVITRQPDDAEALLGLATALYRNHQATNALVYLCRALENGTPDSAATVLIWQILSELDGQETATEHASTEQMADATVQLLKEADPDTLWPSARSAIAKHLIRAGVDEELLRTDRVDEPFLDPDAVLPPGTLLTRFHESREEGVLPETIENALERLSSNETDAEAWFVLGRDSMARDETETAQELFRRAAYLEPGRVKYRINLARALTANAEYADAYQVYLSVETLDPESRADRFQQEEARANRRSLLSRLILVARQAIAADDDTRAWATYRLIAWEDELPDADGMRSAILRLSIDRVMKAHKQGDPEAIRLARQHLERDPESVYVRQVLGQALMTAERFREAAEIWGSLTESLPDNARMYLQYAKCLERSGAGEAALEAAERAIEFDPGLESAQIIRDRLKT